MKRKLVITLLMCMIGVICSWAQHGHDVIYLNNGNIVRGTILKSANDQVEIIASNGETYVYPMVEVRKIERGVSSSERNRTKSEFIEYRQQFTGYWSSVEVDLGNMISLSGKNMQHAELNWINGYRFGEFLKLGVGFGVRYYVNNHEQRSSSIRWAFPIFADIRGNFIPQTSRNFVPYWSFDIGGVVRDGFMMSPTLGLRIGEKRSCMLVGLSYIGQTMKRYDGERRFENGISLKIGYEF